MATGSRTDPLAAYHFYVEITGAGIVGAFRECSGLGSESQVIEYRSADAKGETRVHKVPGVIKWTDLVLKRGLTNNKALWEWRKKIEDGQVDQARTGGSIVLYDQKNGEIARWNFKDAWPSKITGPSLNAGNNEVAIEELTITHEGLDRVK
jgi:phage tail-like protein